MPDYQNSGMVDPRPMQTEAVGLVAASSTKDFYRIRNIQIQQLDHGYIVTVGCQSFAIEKPSDLIAKLSEYINDPVLTEKKHQEGKLF